MRVGELRACQSQEPVGRTESLLGLHYSMTPSKSVIWWIGTQGTCLATANLLSPSPAEELQTLWAGWMWPANWREMGFQGPANSGWALSHCPVSAPGCWHPLSRCIPWCLRMGPNRKAYLKHFKILFYCCNLVKSFLSKYPVRVHGIVQG